MSYTMSIAMRLKMNISKYQKKPQKNTTYLTYLQKKKNQETAFVKKNQLILFYVNKYVLLHTTFR